jgi:UrcA family protein
MLRLIATLPLIAVLVSTPVALAEKHSPASHSVSYADLDLSEPAGVDVLMKRLNGAARKVCGPRPMTVLYGQLPAHLDCLDQATREAVDRIGSPAVSLAFNARTNERTQLASR